MVTAETKPKRKSNPARGGARQNAGRKRGPIVRESLAGLKGSAEFKVWFDELVARSRMNASTMIEFALLDFAAKIGHTDPAPRR